MQVYMLKDVEKVGMSGQIVKVSDGYATNFLLPRKLAKKIASGETSFYQEKQKKAEVSKKILSSKAAMLAERIKNMHITIKKRIHDDGKLYGAVNSNEIVDLLKAKDVSINKKQVEFLKTIKMVGEHKVVIRLSSKLKPTLTLKIVGKEGE